jgi:hypothetical protein
MLFFCLFCFVYFFRAHELNQDHRCDCGFTSFIYFECAKVHKGQAGEVGFLLPLYGVPGIGLRLLILVARDFYLLRHLADLWDKFLRVVRLPGAELGLARELVQGFFTGTHTAFSEGRPRQVSFPEWFLPVSRERWLAYERGLLRIMPLKTHQLQGSDGIF